MSTIAPSDRVWSGGLTAVGLSCIGAYGVLTVWAFDHTSEHLSRGLAVAPVFLVGLLGLAEWWGRGNPQLARLLRLSALAHVITPFAFYLLVETAFEGSADAIVYTELGESIAEDLRRGVVDFSPEAMGGFVFPGTGTIIILTGVLFALLGSSALIGFLCFSTLAFTGQYLLYRAAVIAVPHLDLHRYAWLVLLLPSMVFWTSAIGKEAWVLLFLAVCAVGVARWLRDGARASPIVGLGLGGLALVRPHVAAMVAIAVFAALARRPGHGRRRVVGLLVTGTVIAALAFLTVDFLGVGDAEDPVVAGLEQASVQSRGGDTTIRAARVTSPADLPGAAVTVLLRPLPHEARSATMLVTSLEGVLLIALLIGASLRHGSFRDLGRLPYATFAGVYVLLFIVAFSYMSNLGLLARQRTQALPFLLLFLVPSRPADDEVRT